MFLDSAGNVDRARALKPFWEREIFGRVAMLFDGRDQQELARFVQAMEQQPALQQSEPGQLLAQLLLALLPAFRLRQECAAAEAVLAVADLERPGQIGRASVIVADEQTAGRGRRAPLARRAARLRTTESFAQVGACKADELGTVLDAGGIVALHTGTAR